MRILVIFMHVIKRERFYRRNEDENISNSEEYKEIQRLIEIQKCKDYLSSTDYVISKLNEAKIESEEEYQNLKEKYQETLVKRAEARKRINELGG